MIDPVHLKNYIIEPALKAIELPHPEARTILLLGTAAVETDMGFSLHQRGGGPGLGLWSMEPNTHACNWDNFLVYRPILKAKIEKYVIPELGHDNLIGNLYYAAMMAAVKYYRSPRRMPAKDDIYGMAEFWRYDYNSVKGAFENKEAIDKFMYKFDKYVRPIL